MHTRSIAALFALRLPPTVRVDKPSRHQRKGNRAARAQGPRPATCVSAVRLGLLTLSVVAVCWFAAAPAAAEIGRSGTWSGTIAVVQEGSRQHHQQYRGVDSSRKDTGNSSHKLAWRARVNVDGYLGADGAVDVPGAEAQVEQYEWAGSFKGDGTVGHDGSPCAYQASAALSGPLSHPGRVGVTGSGIDADAGSAEAALSQTVPAGCTSNTIIGFDAGPPLERLLLGEAPSNSAAPAFDLCPSPVALPLKGQPEGEKFVVHQTVTSRCTGPTVAWFGDSDLTVEHDFSVTTSVDLTFTPSEPICERGVPRLRVGNAIGAGCFKRVGAGRYETTQPAQVGGVSLDPSPKLTLNTGTGRLGGRAVVAIGTLRLPITAADVPTHHPRWDLSFSTEKAGTLFSGMPLSGSLSGKWIDGGEGLESTATVDVDALAARAGLDAVVSGSYVARPGGSLTFRSHNGSGVDLRGAEVRIGEVSLLPQRWTRFSRRISLKGVRVAYRDDDGVDEWSGEATLTLPMLKLGTPMEVSGRLTIRDGAFAGGGATVNNLNIPLGSSPVFFQGAEADLRFRPELGMRVAGLGSLGPRVFDKALLDGSIALGLGSLASSACEGADLSGDAEVNQGISDSRRFALKFSLGSCIDVARLAYEVFGTGEISFPGGFGAEGSFRGWIAAATGTFELKGTSKIRLPGLPDLEGDRLLSDRGIAGCGKLGWLSGGFGYRWGDALPEPFRGCELAAWSSAGRAARRQADDATGQMAAVPVSGTPRLVAFRATAASAAPRLRVTGPDGAAFESPADPTQVLFDDRVLIFPHPEARQTIAIVRAPARGAWRVEAADDAAGALVALETAGPLPPLAVRGRLSRSGPRRTLHWSAPGAPGGQTLRFVEVGTGVARAIGKGTGTSGQVRFRATAAPVRARTVIAQVVQDGLPRASVTVARFRAPGLARVARPQRLRVTARGGVVRASFRRAPGAALYVLTLSGQSRSIELLTRRPSIRVRRLGWRPSAASVIAIAGDGRRSPPTRARVRSR